MTTPITVDGHALRTAFETGKLLSETLLVLLKDGCNRDFDWDAAAQVWRDQCEHDWLDVTEMRDVDRIRRCLWCNAEERRPLGDDDGEWTPAADAPTILNKGES